jgi:hypothetical protein
MLTGRRQGFEPVYRGDDLIPVECQVLGIHVARVDEIVGDEHDWRGLGQGTLIIARVSSVSGVAAEPHFRYGGARTCAA